MTNLRELISSNKDALLAGLPGEGEPLFREDVLSFLADIDRALDPAAPPKAPPAEGTDASDRISGVTIPEAGADVVAVANAVGGIHSRILEHARGARVELTVDEHQLLTSHATIAIARAAGKQARRHEWELHHLAHQLRNPLGSAMMAITLVRGRVDFGGELRLIELADRNLKRLQGMIDEAVGTPSQAAE